MITHHHSASLIFTYYHLALLTITYHYLSRLQSCGWSRLFHGCALFCRTTSLLWTSAPSPNVLQPSHRPPAPCRASRDEWEPYYNSPLLANLDHHLRKFYAILKNILLNVISLENLTPRRRKSLPWIWKLKIDCLLDVIPSDILKQQKLSRYFLKPSEFFFRMIF